MNEAETTLFLELMARFFDLLSSAGCNDFEMAVTPENEAIIRAMLQSGDQWDEASALRTYPRHARTAFVYATSDTSLLRYLVRKITGKDIDE